MKKLLTTFAVLIALSPLAQAQPSQRESVRQDLRHGGHVVARDTRAAAHRIAHPLRGKVRCRDGIVRTNRPGACARHNGVARRY
jgi:hypothetical protein